MQLSLSTNVPATPEAAVPGAPAVDPLTGLPVCNSTDKGAVSFEDFLPEGGTPAKPATAEQGPDVEKAASILACLCWVPGMPPPATTPEPVAPESGTDEMSALEGESTAPSYARNVPAASAAPIPTVFCAVPSSRAFATKGGAPVDQSPASTDASRPVPAEAGRLGLNTGVAPAVAPDASEASMIVAAALPQPVKPTAAPLTRRLTATTSEAGKTEAVTLSTGADASAPVVVAPTRGAERRGGVPTPADPTALPVSQTRPENIAAEARSFTPAPTPDNTAGKKDFLTTGQTTVNTPAQSVGIGVAQRVVDMSAAPSNRPKSVPTVESVAQVAGTSGTTSALSFTADTPAPVATLRETLAAVVNVVEALERRAETTQKAVDLQFHVGPERLALRVELRDGTVHTTFRTESPELRTALSHEWQSVARTVSDSPLRIADPVFASTPAGAGESASGSLGQGAPQQRGQQNPEPARFSLPADFSESNPSETTPENPAAPKSNALLQAFA
jgi:hypothetical protein